MEDIKKSNDNTEGHQIIYPLPPLKPEAHHEREIYARFMQHLRNVPTSKAEIKILSAIQFTADMLDIADALVAKTLVDCGLRARRSAFPSAYLEFVDQSLMRSGWDVGGPTKGALALRKFWDKIGEDQFAVHQYDKPQVLETVLLES